MNRFKLILFVLPAVLFSNIEGRTGQANKSRSADKKRPNIVLFVVDDMGTDDAGCYGTPAIRTPGLDQLATEGTRFSHAYGSSPSCSASRSTILTGLHNHANGQYGHSHRYLHFSAMDWVKSLPVLLNSAGYRTMRVGKLHLAPKSVFRFEDYMPKKKDYPDLVKRHDSQSPFYPESGSDVPPVQLAEDLREFIESEEQGPFFLYFCTWDPHRPFRRKGSQEISPEDVTVPSHLPDIPEIREDLAKYYMSVERADKGLERLIEILKESSNWDNTVLIFTSDNGRPFPGAKMNLYDPGIRLPLVIHDPYAKVRNIESDAFVSFTDITPTILDYAGVEFSDYPLHGRSFRSQVEMEQSVGFDTVYSSHSFHETQMYYPMRMIRTRNYKLIWNLAYEQVFPLGISARGFYDFVARNNLSSIRGRSLKAYLYRPQFELYDMKSDPDEVDNLAYDPEHRAVLESLKNRIYQFQNETSDGWRVYQDYEKVRELVHMDITN